MLVIYFIIGFIAMGLFSVLFDNSDQRRLLKFLEKLNQDYRPLIDKIHKMTNDVPDGVDSLEISLEDFISLREFASLQYHPVFLKGDGTDYFPGTTIKMIISTTINQYEQSNR